MSIDNLKQAVALANTSNNEGTRHALTLDAILAHITEQPEGDNDPDLLTKLSVASASHEDAIAELRQMLATEPTEDEQAQAADALKSRVQAIVEELVAPFTQRIDELTAQMQTQVDALTAAQRRFEETLAKAGAPADEGPAETPRRTRPSRQAGG